MAGTAVLGRLSWQLGTVVEVVDETPRVRTVVLDLDDTCTYAGNFNDSAGSGNQIQVDVYNPDNPGPDTRLVFSSEPFRLSSGTFACPETAQATATYTVTDGTDARIYALFIENLARWARRETLINEVGAK